VNRPGETGAAGTQEPLGDHDIPREAPEFVTQMQICRRLGITDETWRRWRAAGKTPDPVALPGRPRWRASEIEAFLRGRVADPKAPRVHFATAVRRRQYRHRGV
jgi:predicted DNA-binding transcriptional regulator AlpA